MTGGSAYKYYVGGFGSLNWSTATSPPLWGMFCSANGQFVLYNPGNWYDNYYADAIYQGDRRDGSMGYTSGTRTYKS